MIDRKGESGESSLEYFVILDSQGYNLEKKKVS